MLRPALQFVVPKGVWIRLLLGLLVRHQSEIDPFHGSVLTYTITYFMCRGGGASPHGGLLRNKEICPSLTLKHKSGGEILRKYKFWQRNFCRERKVLQVVQLLAITGGEPWIYACLREHDHGYDCQYGC
ncbi:hypothetical protein MGLY_06450 [Neomoorella glycerini]|uniref:Uncharacterized protein n=1 Tax=Neomoorella glycerini TaxID=55779 RepID=A0A6I5ZN22_9FIRM|nr:hypothetical protein MGLY_06450 [Moorella glycerini]